MRVSMSATGSVSLIFCISSSPVCLVSPGTCGGVIATACRAATCTGGIGNRPGRLLHLVYQDDFETPGISPRRAKPRKHKRQMPNLRRNARGRPQILQRLCLRLENFGFLASLTRFAVVAN